MIPFRSMPLASVVRRDGSRWYRSPRVFVAGCLLLALAVRLAWIVLIRPDPVSDSNFYLQEGVRLSEGQGYGATAFRVPGYPILLGVLFKIFGPQLVVARLANVALSLGSLLLVYLIAKRLFRSEAVARVTMVVLALWPNHVGYGSLIASEPLFLFLMLLGIWLALFLTPIAAGAAGLALGAAALVRPAALVLPAFLFLAMLVHMRGGGLRDHLLRFAILHTAFVAVLLPWLIRNDRLLGHAVMATESGVTLLVGNNPYADGRFRVTDRISALFPPLVLTEYERSAHMQRVALRFVREHPRQWLRLLPRKFWYAYRADNDAAVWNSRGMKGTRKGRWMRLSFKAISDSTYRVFGVAFLPSVALLAWRRRLRRVPASAFVGFWVMSAFVLVHLPLHGQTRLHYPVIPWMVMYVAAGIALLLARPRPERLAPSAEGP